MFLAIAIMIVVFLIGWFALTQFTDDDDDDDDSDDDFDEIDEE